MPRVFYLTISFFVAAFVLVLPLSRLQENENYNPISSLSSEAYKQGLPIYQLDRVSPEVIWQYGEKLKTIKDDNGDYNFPSESQFGILTSTLTEDERTKLQNEYKIEKQPSFDLNRSQPESKQYKDRLVTEYYILTRK